MPQIDSKKYLVRINCIGGQVTVLATAYCTDKVKTKGGIEFDVKTDTIGPGNVQEPRDVQPFDITQEMRLLHSGAMAFNDGRNDKKFIEETMRRIYQDQQRVEVKVTEVVVTHFGK